MLIFMNQATWRSMQQDLMRQYKNYQDLIDQCYPGSNFKLPVEIDAILDIFSFLIKYI